MTTFKFDAAAFQREIRKAMDQGVRQHADNIQAHLDGLSRTHRGQPLPVIKGELEHYFTGIGGHITEPHLSAYAKQIQGGGKIKIQYDGF